MAELKTTYWFIYRNYFPSKGCFFNWTDTKGLYDEKSAREWFTWVKEYLTDIEIIRPPRKKVIIKLPFKEHPVNKIDRVREDLFFPEWLATVKIEPRMWYVIDQILDDYYLGTDWIFYKRDKKKDDPDVWVIFTMREFIDWVSRLSPLQVRTFTEKETQKVNFVDRELWRDVYDIPFTYEGKNYKTNFFWLYWPQFREAIFPNSDFWGSRLQPRQRESFINRGKLTIIKAPRSWWKSVFATSFIATYLFKELNMPHEKDRPFLIIYGWLSKEANLQVVEYLRSMAKKITTNKNILNWNKWEQILTLYDGVNERKIKFVSQWQEWQGFRWLRPHLIILDEASRLSREMYDVAAGTVEAPIILISTTNKDDKRNWFEDLYKEWIAKQRNYIPVWELIKKAWIKFWFNKVKTREELIKLIDGWVIKEIRQYIYTNRPIVSLKYTIYDVAYMTDDEQQEQVDKYMLAWEDVCLAELFNELSDARVAFNTDWLIESKIPDTYDFISIWYDEAEEHDNPALVWCWWKNDIAYVFHSEILDKDWDRRYKQISDFIAKCKLKSKEVRWWVDLTRLQNTWLREIQRYWLEPDFPMKWTTALHWDVSRVRPFFLIWRKWLVTLCQDQFFKKSRIVFSSDLDVEDWLLYEIANFKQDKKTWKFVWEKKKSDDQVCALMVSLFWMHEFYIKENVSTVNPYMSQEEVARQWHERNNWNAEVNLYEEQMYLINNTFW